MRVIFPLLSFVFILTVFTLPATLIGKKPIQTEEIPYVMERFFTYHAEKSKLDTELVRRCFVTYLRHFDPDHSYLLEEEVLRYENMDESTAQRLAEEMQNGNFSSFYDVEDLIRRAINRSKRLRRELHNWVLEAPFSKINIQAKREHAKTEEELLDRWKVKLTKFYFYHKRHVFIDSKDRKEQLVALFVRDLRRKESPYLALSKKNIPLDPISHEHGFSVRILKAFAQSLDAHTCYFSPEEAKELRSHLEKEFEGFGIVLAESLDGVFIAKIIPESPADKQGMLSEKDLIIEIDGQETKDLTFEEVSNLLEKKEDGSIQLGVKRPENSDDPDVFYVELEKAPISMEKQRIFLRSSPFGSGVIGAITLRSFYDNGRGVTSEKDIKKALSKLRSEGEIKGLVLDLRENGGGFLTQAVRVASLFIRSGVVVISKYGKNEMHYLRSVDRRKSYEGPMLILTSKLSASASEIVAQALQDYGVALVVGDSRTFGKGSIQYQTITSPDTDIYFKVTIGKYYTVSGKTTQLRGVIADVVIPTSFAPFRLGEEYLKHPISADEVPPAYEDPLADVDPRIQLWLQEHYLPYLQEKVTKYRSMLPYLRKNSQARIRQNPHYQAFLQNQENIKKRLAGDASVPVDLSRNFAGEDLQMEEALYVLQDMIYLESKQANATSFLENSTITQEDAA